MRGIALNGIAIPGSAGSAEGGGFPGSAGLGGFAQPGSAGLDGPGSRRGSALGMGLGMGVGMGTGGQRMIAPGQLPGPQRKGSMASVGGAS